MRRLLRPRSLKHERDELAIVDGFAHEVCNLNLTFEKSPVNMRLIYHAHDVRF